MQLNELLLGHGLSGQRCTASKTCVVMESVADKLAALLQAEVKAAVGDQH